MDGLRNHSSIVKSVVLLVLYQLLHRLCILCPLQSHELRGQDGTPLSPGSHLDDLRVSAKWKARTSIRTYRWTNRHFSFRVKALPFPLPLCACTLGKWACCSTRKRARVSWPSISTRRCSLRSFNIPTGKPLSPSPNCSTWIAFPINPSTLSYGPLSRSETWWHASIIFCTCVVSGGYWKQTTPDISPRTPPGIHRMWYWSYGTTNERLVRWTTNEILVLRDYEWEISPLDFEWDMSPTGLRLRD